jgi:predicted RNase H-like nuclease
VSGRVAGVDAWRGGWVAVTLRDGAFETAFVAAAFGDLLGELGEVAVVGVDMPIGLVAAGWRQADRLARAGLGSRRSSIFATPPRPVLDAGGYAEANLRCRELTGQGLSRQAWALVPRIREVDEFRTDRRLFEVHPETSFQRLAGAPPASKRTWAGLTRRRALLSGAGITLPDDLGAAGAAGPDDVLDAGAAAWTAARIAAGTAVSLPDPPEPGDDGRPIAIWS